MRTEKTSVEVSIKDDGKFSLELRTKTRPHARANVLLRATARQCAANGTEDRNGQEAGERSVRMLVTSRWAGSIDRNAHTVRVGLWRKKIKDSRRVDPKTL